MRVETERKSVNLFAVENNQEKASSREHKKSIYGGELGKEKTGKTLLERKREQAKKDARRLIEKQYASDQKLVDEMDAGRKRMAQRKEDASRYNAEEQEYQKRRENLADQFGLSAEEAATQDEEIALREKAKQGKGMLTKEDQEQLAKLGEPTEYQQAAMELDEQVQYYRKQKEDALGDVVGESQMIHGMKKQLEAAGREMIAAKKGAEVIEQGASRDIISTLVQEGKKEQDKQLEEAVEKAQETAKKQKEEEALLKKRELKEAEQTAEANSKVNEILPRLEAIQEQVKDGIQEIAEKNKLLVEDLKGLEVDRIL